MSDPTQERREQVERARAEVELGDLDTLDGVKSWMRGFFTGADQPSADDLIERFEQVLRRDIAKAPNEVAAAYEAGFKFAKREYQQDAAAVRALAYAEAREAVRQKRVIALESAEESRKQNRDSLDDAVTRGMTNALTIGFDAALAALDTAEGQ